jgi:Arc/MetJ-type ribon-helix-helix transcriptional regulator
MRKIINISMPETLRLYMVKRTKDRGFGSVSEYIRDLVRNDLLRHLNGMDDESGPREIFHEGRLYRHYPGPR